MKTKTIKMNQDEINELINKFLEEGIKEAQESDEYTTSAKNGLTKGMGDDKRKAQLKNLQSGTEKIMKALWLKRGKNIDKSKDKTISLGEIIYELSKEDKDITSEEIDILNKINNANEIKHNLNYTFTEITGVRKLLNKIVVLIKK